MSNITVRTIKTRAERLLLAEQVGESLPEHDINIRLTREQLTSLVFMLETYDLADEEKAIAKMLNDCLTTYLDGYA